MGRRRYFIIFAFSVLFVFGIRCQTYSVRILYGPTKFIKHYKKSTFDAPKYSQLWQSSLDLQPDGTKHWHRYWNRPSIVVNVLYMRFGNDAVLGNAIGCLPSMKFSLSGKKQTELYLQIGSGLAYLNKKYDKLSNPFNNVIGSHWNNVTQFSFFLESPGYKNLHIAFGAHFTHFSNARTASPNAGINTGGITLGLIQKFNVKKENIKETSEFNDVIDHKADTVVMKRRWGGDFLFGYGISEYSFTGGPKYGSYFINTGISYALSPFFKIILGAEYEYNQSVYQFYYQDFIPDNEARQKATKYASYLASDLFFGKVVIRAQTGGYLPYPRLREKNTPYYIKLNINLYPFPDHWPVRPYLGILLKSHVEIAQYMGLVSGVSF